MTDQGQTQLPPSAGPIRLLFLHGLFRKSYPTSGRTVAKLLADGLRGASVSSATDLVLEDGAHCRRYQVVPGSESSAWRPVEVVEVNYDDIIRNHYAGRPLLFSTLLGFWAFLSNLPRLRRLFWRGHPHITAGQAIMTTGMVLLLVLVLAVMLALLFPVVVGAVKYLGAVIDWIAAPAQELSGSQPVKSEAGGTDNLAGSIALLAFLAVLGRLLLPKGISEKFENAADSLFAMMDYQKPESDLRQALLTRVQSAFDALAGPGEDRSVSVLAFSQGSLLAIDALFPTQSPAWNGTGSPRIDLLVTLGCPLAIVTRLWPTRPRRLREKQAGIDRWINFHETKDQLGGGISALIQAEGIDAKVEDREFSYRDPIGRPTSTPHFAYWLEGTIDQPPAATRIAAELAGRS